MTAKCLPKQWITGREYTVGHSCRAKHCRSCRIDAANTFYDYEAKYFSDATRYVCPCGLTADQERDWGEMASRAFAAVGASGWGRVDFMLGPDGHPLLLEVNTVPGMTSHSLVPMAAQAAGIEFDELVWRILETSMQSGAAHASVAEVADGR